jgi:hypothetical protein
MEPAVFAMPRKHLVMSILVYIGELLVLVALGIGILIAPDLPWQSSVGLFFAGFGVVLGIIAIIYGCVVVDPPRLRVDGEGLTMSAGSRRYQILWSQVEEIRIIHFQRRPNARRKETWLMVWPRSGWPVTRGRGVFLPQWRKEFSGLKVCNLRIFGSTVDVFPEFEVSETVAQFAGECWNEAREPR